MTSSIFAWRAGGAKAWCQRVGIPLAAAYLRSTPVHLGKGRIFRYFESALSRAKGLGQRTVKTKYGFNMRVDLEGDMLGWHVYLSGIWEPPTSKIMAALIRPGDVVVDIGANVGYFTLLAATKTGPRGKVLAFEPVPSIRLALEQNLLLNNVNHVDVYPIALSNSTGRMTIHENKGLSSLRSIENAKASIVIETKPFDLLIDRNLPIKLIKMDVEGAEGIVLDGMLNSLKTHKPDLIIEITDGFLKEMGHSASELCDKIVACGYKMYYISSRGLSIIPYPPKKWAVQFNAFFSANPVPEGLLVPHR